MKDRRMKSIGRMAAAALVASASAGLVARAATFTNPIFPNQSDAFMTKHSGYYYLAYSDYDKNIYLKRSRNLETIYFGETARIWSAPDWGRFSRHAWSPFLFFSKNRWLVYFSADGGKVFDHRIFVLQSRSDDPMGPYAFRGQIKDAWDPENRRCALTLFPLRWRGENYALISRCGTPSSQVAIARMRDAVTLSSDQSFISTPVYDYEGIVAEGPIALVHKDKLFVVHSSNDTHINYSITLLTYLGGDLLKKDSWRKSSVPVFHSYSGADGEARSPGAPSIVPSPDGSEDWLIYHGCSGPENCNGGNEQSIRASRIGWTADGMPDFGHPAPAGTPQSVPAGSNGAGAPQTELVDDATAGNDVNRITYDGTWLQVSARGHAYLGSEHVTRDSSARATIRFRGVQARLYGSHGPDHGQMTVSVDGGAETIVDLYRAAASWGGLTYISGILPPGEHHIALRIHAPTDAATGRDLISLDRVEIMARSVR